MKAGRPPGIAAEPSGPADVGDSEELRYVNTTKSAGKTSSDYKQLEGASGQGDLPGATTGRAVRQVANWERDLPHQALLSIYKHIPVAAQRCALMCTCR